MEWWGEMSKELKWGTLENMKMDYYGEEETSEGAGETAGRAPVSSKPPPKAPSTYREDLKAENDTDSGKGKDSEGID